MLHRRAFNHDTLIANSFGVSFGFRQGLLEKWLGQSILSFICLDYVLIENMYFLTLIFKKKNTPIVKVEGMGSYDICYALLKI